MAGARLFARYRVADDVVHRGMSRRRIFHRCQKHRHPGPYSRSRGEPGRRSVAKLLTRDEARRIADEYCQAAAAFVKAVAGEGWR
jgi:hypothetical protein